MAEFDFNHKTVVVTGGGTGIGFAIARSFLKDGANVVISGRRADKLRQASVALQKELGNIGGNLCFVPSNVSVPKNLQLLIREVKKRFGSLDIFINNSGVWSLTPIMELNKEHLEKHIDNNFKTVVYGTQIAAKNMVNGGAIINIGSFAGLMPMKQASLYSCLKSSIHVFTRSSAAELATKGIRVNCVIPGVIRTEMTTDYIDANYEKLIQVIALKRIGEAQDVANGVLFLCSDLASYITGATLEISGGKFLTQ